MSLPARILVIDDEPAILFAYQRLLERQGLGIDACDNFRAAMEFLAVRSYDVVIVDLRLEGTDNADGLRIVQAVSGRPDTKVIVITGYGRREERQAVLELGAAHYFEKPVLPAVILQAVRSCLGGAAEPPAAAVGGRT